MWLIFIVALKSSATSASLVIETGGLDRYSVGRESNSLGSRRKPVEYNVLLER